MDVNRKTKIIFLGTPEFAIPTLEALVNDHNFEVALVVTEPDRVAGRGKKIIAPPVKILAQKFNIPIIQPENIKAISYKLYAIKPDLAVVVAYGQIIPKGILNIPKFGFLNIHPSLLPKYRGPSPIQAAILNGDKETGVTIIKLDEKMDHGDVVAKSKIKNLSQRLIVPWTKKSKIWNNSNLSKKLAKLGAKLLINILPDYLSNKIKPIPQDDSQATYTKLIKKTDGLVDWNEPVEKIYRKICAYNPWPGTFFIINDKRFIIEEAYLEKGLLSINKIKPEGKKSMSFTEFKNGYQYVLTKLPKYVKI